MVFIDKYQNVMIYVKKKNLEASIIKWILF